MSWHTWWLFLVTETALSLSPGPAVLLVVSQGLRHGGRRSIFSSCGILFANAVYFAVSAAGLGAAILASYELFSLIRWAGAAYLVWLGLRAICSSQPTFLAETNRDPGNTVSNGRLFLNGFLLQSSNPKALVFFAAILPQFVTPAEPMAMQFLVLGITSVVAEFFVLLGYGVLAGRASELARQPRFARAADRVAGVLLLGAAVGLAGVERD
jgi:threonine/homoserine/homoserine lactone efflux protein